MKIQGNIMKSIFITVLALWMVAASGGMALYLHLCQCTGKDHLTLTEVHHCHCQQHHEDGHSLASACCPHEDGSDECPIDTGSHCCRTALFFVVKTDQFLVSSTTLLQHTVEADLVHFIHPIVSEEILTSGSFLSDIPEEPPPPTRSVYLNHLGAFHSSLSA